MAQESNEREMLAGSANPVVRGIYTLVGFGCVLLCIIGALTRIAPGISSRLPAVVVLFFPYVFFQSGIVRSIQMSLKRTVTSAESAQLILIPPIILTGLSAGIYIDDWQTNAFPFCIVCLLAGLFMVMVERARTRRVNESVEAVRKTENSK